MRRTIGLTVMELIVAVLIVAILVALLLPVIAASRRKGYETQCVSNMRQVAGCAADVSPRLRRLSTVRPVCVSLHQEPRGVHLSA